MKNSILSMKGSELSFDQIEILKGINAENQRKENAFFAFLFIDALIIIAGIILYAFHPEYFSFLSQGSGILAIAPLAIPIKEKKEKKEKTDDANLGKIKESKKEKKDQTRSSLYKGIDDLSMRDQKKERSKIRRRLDAFCKDILGMDRKKEEKEKSIKEFNAFYKKNWKIQDYKIDNFSNRSDEDQRRDYQEILILCKKSLGKE